MSAFWKNGLIGAFLLGFIGLLGSFNADAFGIGGADFGSLGKGEGGKKR